MLHRRLSRDYETLPARSEAVIHLAMTDLMAHRFAGEATASWRDPTITGANLHCRMKRWEKTTSQS